jgi:hypothetical protein
MHKTYDVPAFPPQIVQDNLGRVLAPIPGLTKREYFAITLLPHFLESKKVYAEDGNKLTPYRACVKAAELLIDELTKTNDNENNIQIVE